MNLALLFTTKFYAEPNNKATAMPVIVNASFLMIYPGVFNKMAADLPATNKFLVPHPAQSNNCLQLRPDTKKDRVYGTYT